MDAYPVPYAPPEPLGLYVHVPFCRSKCPYCDFYSLPCGEDASWMDATVEALERAIDYWADRLTRAHGSKPEADTLYFGGGTPSLLGGERLTRLIAHVRSCFVCAPQMEITLEANPADDLEPTLRAFAAVGGNRVSLGMQSADDTELRLLGRRHRAADTVRTVEAVRRAGIANLSLDLMLGVEGQTTASALRSADVCAQLGAEHVSAYLLKLEPGTPLYARRTSLKLPDDDAVAQRYLAVAEVLEAHGYRQYEISNFARPGYASRHNTKYWDSQPYIGVGPAAHSYVDGARWRYARDLTGFLNGAPPLPEDEQPGSIVTGSEEEYLMLRLRLTEGLTEERFRQRFGKPLPTIWRTRAQALQHSGAAPLLLCDAQGIRLTKEGFLVSNAILSRLLDL